MRALYVELGSRGAPAHGRVADGSMECNVFSVSISQSSPRSCRAIWSIYMEGKRSRLRAYSIECL
jgi:hypothetical protein